MGLNLGLDKNKVLLCIFCSPVLLPVLLS